ncbi:MAG: hypothetical protein KatS3mg103_0300 [Phycisphaerales bacterium]|nr:MAG: hypothetical protein KatS3mg103_0300 [Phycisphaerales bacterium]
MPPAGRFSAGRCTAATCSRDTNQTRRAHEKTRTFVRARKKWAWRAGKGSAGREACATRRAFPDRRFRSVG